MSRDDPVHNINTHDDQTRKFTEMMMNLFHCTNVSFFSSDFLVTKLNELGPLGTIRKIKVCFSGKCKLALLKITFQGSDYLTQKGKQS